MSTPNETPNRTSLVLRPFEPADRDAVGRLILSIQREEFGVPITLEDQPDLAEIPTFYQRGSGGFWVACDGGRIVGTVALIDIGGRECALRKMFVDPAYRGKEAGVALGLMKAAFDHARAHGVEAIYLGTTDAFKAAHRFYEKHGWTELPKAALPDRFPAMRLDTKFYRRGMAPFA
ncbi:MAG TPA: GNAT family N-acetyltransferase [Holophagaceae bacterium]|nr:GNAT family N-acetyltransferase [Holophagaceae bacterium]